MRKNFAFLAAFLGLAYVTAESQSVPFVEVAERALSQSKLTMPGSTPFHLKAHIEEQDSPGTDIKADIELFWAAPDKWRRIISNEDFSQTRVVNGDKIFEENQGDYYPAWLRKMVTGLTDPLPMLDELKRSNPAMRKPSGDDRSTSCLRLQGKIGVPPVENSSSYVICFAGSRGLLESVGAPGYSHEFKQYKRFKNKQVAHLLVDHPEPGDEIQGAITELTEFDSSDELLFSIAETTPPERQIRSVAVSEATIRKMAVDSLEVNWPSVRDGKTSGLVSIYIWIDRAGAVREVKGLNSDNPGMTDAAIEAAKKWKFKPAVSEGSPVQVESTLTFAFQTKVENAVVILADAEVRKLATNIVEPMFAPAAKKGATVTIRVNIGMDGKLLGAGNPENAPNELFLPAYVAVTKWKFQPYIKDGKPDVYKGDVIFRVP